VRDVDGKLCVSFPLLIQNLNPGTGKGRRNGGKRERRALTSVDGRMKGFDSTSEHLRSLGDGRDVPIASWHTQREKEASDQSELVKIKRVSLKDPKPKKMGYVLDLEASLPDHLSGSSRSQKPESELAQGLGKGEETGLVVDREESCVRSGEAAEGKAVRSTALLIRSESRIAYRWAFRSG
jgi:hypothetical protein